LADGTEDRSPRHRLVDGKSAHQDRVDGTVLK
jgi:hypothetical protein